MYKKWKLKMIRTMRTRRFKLKRLVILMLLSFILFAWADDQEDPLWQKAVQIALDNQNWVAGTIELDISALDDTEHEIMTSSLMFSYEEEDGEIVGYYDGGKRSGDLIPESDDMVQQFLSQDMKPENSSIFYNNSDWNLIVKRSGNEKKISKKQCAEFTYTSNQPGENGEMIPATGSVWLELETGIPGYHEQNLHPPIEMIEKLVNKVTYKYKKGDFYIKKMETITSVNAMGQKGKMKNTVEFKKYFRYEEDQ